MTTKQCDIIAERAATNAFKRRFRQLCEERDVRYQAVADALGIARSALAAIYDQSYASKLNLDAALAIARYFEVSLDSMISEK